MLLGVRGIRSPLSGVRTTTQQRRTSSSTRRGFSTLVLAEHERGKLTPGTLHTLTAGKALGKPVTVLVAADPGTAETLSKEAAKVQGVSQVLVASDDALSHGLPESLAGVVRAAVERVGATHVLAPSSTFGKNVLPRLAALLDVSPVSDVLRIEDQDTFVRPIYAGNALATVKSLDKIKVMTIRTTAFDKATTQDSSAPLEQLQHKPAANPVTWEKDELRASDRPDLSSASIVVSGGRGMKSGENFKLLEELADLLGGAVGASRAAVDAGFVPNDLQIGQTGKIIAPGT